MANIEQFLVSPQPLPLASGNNSFVSNWGDKRSCANFGVSVVFYGVNAPDGYAYLETSNAPLAQGTSYGQPAFSADDYQEIPNSQLTIGLLPSGQYGGQWQASNIGAHYVRVRYTSLGNVAGLSVNVYLNGIKNSD